MSILDYFMLHDKKAVVTGGARGIGRAGAIALAEVERTSRYSTSLMQKTPSGRSRAGERGLQYKVDLTKKRS